MARAIGTLTRYVPGLQSLGCENPYTRHVGRPALLAAAAIVGGVACYRRLGSYLKSRHLDSKRRQRQLERVAKFKKLNDKLAVLIKENESLKTIPVLSLKDLQRRLRGGEISPVEVVHAYQWKALQVHEKTNCLTDIIEEAEIWAEELKDKDRTLPLYGVPISVKDNVSIKGYDCTEGRSVNLGKLFQEDCAVIKALRQLGAIPFVRTNMTQLGFSHESSNPIYGATLHPLDPTRGPGGSSSGEGALIGAGGSILGIGTDNGGSLRCPASFCGTTSLKPTRDRLGDRGRPNDKHQTIMMSTVGPMARDVDSLVTLMDALLAGRAFYDLDPCVPPITFDRSLTQSEPSAPRLRVGVYTYDGNCRATPTCERAVLIAKDLLQRSGYEVVDWKPREAAEGYWTAIQANCADGGTYFLRKMEHERVDPSMLLPYMIYNLPRIARTIIASLWRLIDSQFGRAVSSTRGLRSVAEWWDLTVKNKELKDKMISSWEDAGLDAVICPVFGTPALKLKSASELIYASSYVMLYNGFDFTAGVVPITTVSAEDQDNLKNYPSSPYVHSSLSPRSPDFPLPSDGFTYRKIKKKMAGAEGLPVGVQVVALPWKEEMCLRVMRDIEKALHTPTPSP